MGLWDKITDLAHEATGIPTADEKRNMQKQQREQMAAYKRQRELTEYETKRRREQELRERQRLDEKRVRHLRHNYASDGFLGSSNDEVTSGETKETLGS